MAIKNLGRIVGKSAYEIWLDQGNTGTEEDYLNSLKGSDGKDGITPVKGTDYFTEEDKQEMINQVPQSDWSQNDSTQPDYIKNRICYSEGVTTNEVVILERASRQFTYVDYDVIQAREYYFSDEEKNILNSLKGKSGILRFTLGDVVCEETVENLDEDMPVSFYPNDIRFGISFSEIGTYQNLNEYYDISLIFITTEENIVKLPEKYLPSTAALKSDIPTDYLTEQVQSDWSQNDETQPDYIKNRVCYETSSVIETTILEAGTRSFSLEDDVVGNRKYLFTEEEKQRFTNLGTVDGILKLTIAGITIEKEVSVINGTVESPVEFEIESFTNGVVYVYHNYIEHFDRSSAEVELIFIGNATTVITISEKYLPDTIATKEYVDSVASGSDEVPTYYIGNTYSTPFVFSEKKPGVYIAFDTEIFYQRSESSEKKSIKTIDGVITIFAEDDGTNTKEFFHYIDNTGRRRVAGFDSNDTVATINWSDTEVLIKNQTQTVSAVHTYNKLPETSVEPTKDTHFTNKAYVDSAITEAINNITDGDEVSY